MEKKKLSRKDTQLFVAMRLSQSDSLFRVAADKLKKADYLELVLNSKVSKIDRALRRVLEEEIGAWADNPTIKSIYYDPSIRQWIDEMYNLFSKEDIMDFFSQAAGLSKDYLRNASVHGSAITYPFLVDLLDVLEKVTKKRILSDDETLPPEPKTYDELATFFATHPRVRVKAKPQRIEV